jgi:hypothetical protein
MKTITTDVYRSGEDAKADRELAKLTLSLYSVPCPRPRNMSPGDQLLKDMYLFMLRKQQAGLPFFIQHNITEDFEQKVMDAWDNSIDARLMGEFMAYSTGEFHHRAAWSKPQTDNLLDDLVSVGFVMADGTATRMENRSNIVANYLRQLAVFDPRKAIKLVFQKWGRV